MISYMNNYKNKYLKYKNKYINLKNQLAGMKSFHPTPENSPKKIDLVKVSPRHNFNLKLYNDSPKKIDLVKVSPRQNFNLKLYNDSPRKIDLINVQPSQNFNLKLFDDSHRRIDLINAQPSQNFNLKLFDDSPRKMKTIILTDQPNFNNINELSTNDKEIISLLNSYYDNWVLTGSVAVKLYLVYLNLQNLINFVTSDIDAFIIKNSKLCNVDERSIGNYTRTQETPQRSVTFLNKINNISFDINCIKSMPKINKIFGINIVRPTVLLSNYLYDIRDKDKEKIDALNIIIKEINNNNYNLRV